MPYNNKEWIEIKCSMEICDNFENGKCGCPLEKVIPNYSSCPGFEFKPNKKFINIIRKDSFLYSSIDNEGKNYIFLGDVKRVLGRLTFMEEGKVRMRNRR